jgi:hypothetical protein
MAQTTSNGAENSSNYCVGRRKGSTMESRRAKKHRIQLVKEEVAEMYSQRRKKNEHHKAG